MRTWISATCRSKPLTINDWPSSFLQCIFVSLLFDAASAVVSTPTLPQGAAQILLRTSRLVSGNRSGARQLIGLGILARRGHGIGTSGGNRIEAFTRVICPISCDVADVLIVRDLVQKFWQHGSISELLLVTSTVRTSNVSSSIQISIFRQIRRLEPPSARQQMLACVPLAFTFGPDACAVDKEVQWTFGASI